jgi:hypothetical protein
MFFVTVPHLPRNGTLFFLLNWYKILRPSQAFDIFIVCSFYGKLNETRVGPIPDP